MGWLWKHERAVETHSDSAAVEALAALPSDFGTFPYCSKKCHADARSNDEFNDVQVEELKQRIEKVESVLRLKADRAERARQKQDEAEQWNP